MRILGVLLSALLLLTAWGGFMQQEAPLVVFVEENSFGLASVTDNGPDGLSSLAAIFRQLGALTGFVRLGEDIPDNARVVVMVRPRRPLPAADLARLWEHIEKGNNLLLALDAPGQLGANPDPQNGGLDRLLTWDYGVSLLNGVIASPESTLESITTLQGSLIEAETGVIPHAVIEPLQRFGIPVRMWGARALQAELFGVEGNALSLLQTTGFGETNPQVFRAEDPAPLEVNIGTDPQGTLVVGAISENSATNSRIAVLGDSESVQNGYGLAGNPPSNPGNLILTQRLAAWLLEIPEENWLPLPSEFTWLEVDGSGSDWQETVSSFVNDASDTSVLPFSIEQVRVFQDQDYLYLLVETRGSPNDNAQLVLQFDTNGDGASDRELTVNSHWIVVTGEAELAAVVRDADFSVGNSLEARLPLRVTGTNSRITALCLTSSIELAFPVADCIDDTIAVRSVPSRSPEGLISIDGLYVTVNSTSAVNLRAEPSTNSTVLATIGIGSIFKATGRNEAGDWIFVQNARHAGWIASFLLTATGDLQTLPVVD